MPLEKSLHNYLSDLGLTQPENLDIEFVKTLQARHVARYSFNNLAVLLGEDISLDLELISHKIVTSKLGGYCFEHNKLSYEVLKSLGYKVSIKLARVLNNQDKDVPRTHRITLLTLDSEVYLMDTGFGSDGLIYPLLLQPGVEQKIGSDVYQITQRSDDEYDVNILKEGDYFTLYRFDLASYSDADCTLGNFYSYKHPNAVFVNNLVVSIKSVSRRVSLRNHILLEREGGVQTKKIVTSPQALHQILSDQFALNIEPVLVEHLFDRFVAPKLAENEGSQL